MFSSLPRLGFLGLFICPSAFAGLFTFTSTSVTALDQNGSSSQFHLDGPSFSSASRSATALSVVGGVTNSVGTATSSSQARAVAGALGVGTRVFVQATGATSPLNASSGFRADPGGGTFFDTEGASAEFSADLTLFPVPGAGVSGVGSVTARLNLSLEGYFNANGLGGIDGTASTSTRLSLRVRFGYVDPITFQQGGNAYTGEVTLNQTTGGGGDFDGGSGLLAGYIGGPLLVSTAATSLPIGVPIQLSVTLSLLTEVQAEGTVEYAGGADFLHTLTLPTFGPVLELPDGYTAQSSELGIQGNAYVPVPEPIGWTVACGLGLGGFGWVRRGMGKKGCMAKE